MKKQTIRFALSGVVVILLLAIGTISFAAADYRVSGSGSATADNEYDAKSQAISRAESEARSNCTGTVSDLQDSVDVTSNYPNYPVIYTANATATGTCRTQ